MLDLDDSRRLDPGLTVHLNGNALISQDGDLHCSTLIQRESRIRQTLTNIFPSRCCRCCCPPGLCGDAGAWWLWIQPSACSQTQPPPPGFYHQTTEHRRSAQQQDKMGEMVLQFKTVHIHPCFLKKNTKLCCRYGLLNMDTDVGMQCYSGSLDVIYSNI